MTSIDPFHHIDCVLLDRDGVVNFDSADYIKHPEEWQPIPGAVEAIVRLQTVVDVAICTNQSGVGRGLYYLSTLDAIHTKLYNELARNGGKPVNIHFCPHLPDAGCHCRKPKPGLLQDALSALGKSSEKALFVGDSERDLQAASAAGCLPVLVLTGNGNKTRSKFTNLDQPPVTYPDLTQLTDAILAAR